MTHEHEVVHSYGWYLKKFIADARAKGATPIVCTLIPRKIWKDGKIARNKGDYAGWAEEVAAAGTRRRWSTSTRSSRAGTTRWGRRKWNRCSATRTPTPAAQARS